MLKEKFLEYFKSERNSSQLTVDSYGTDLDEFEEFFESLNEGITWETVDETVVREWIIYLLDDQKLENSSVNRKLSTLRSFFRYLLRIGIVEKDPMLRVVGPKRKRCCLYLSERRKWMNCLTCWKAISRTKVF